MRTEKLYKHFYLSRLKAAEWGIIMDKKLYNKIRNNIKLDCFAVFIANLNMQSSIWVLYLAYCGMNLAQIGILEGIYHATSIVCEIPSGAAADLLGRKTSMILSRICIAVSCIIMLLSRNLGLFALSFIIQALGNNLNSGSEEALVYDSMKYLGQENQYMHVNGRLNVAIEISQGIATVAGGILAQYSYFWCYSACLLIAILALIPVIFMTEVPYITKKAEQTAVCKMVVLHFQRSFEILKSDIRILKIIVVYSIIFAAETLLFFYSQQYYSNLGYDKIQISFILLVVGGVSCLGAVMSEKIFQKLKQKTAFIAAFVIGLSLCCYAFENVVVSITAFAAAGFFNSVLYPVQSDLLNSLIPSNQRATLISVNSMFFSIAMILLFPAAGFLADIYELTRVLAGIGLGVIVFSFFIAKNNA